MQIIVNLVYELEAIHFFTASTMTIATTIAAIMRARTPASAPAIDGVVDGIVVEVRPVEDEEVETA